MSSKQSRNAAPSNASGDHRILLKEKFCGCKICGLGIEGHQFLHVATAPIKDPSEEFHRLLDAVKQERWTDVVRFHHWEPLLPDAEVFMLRCTDNRTSVAILLCPFELGEPYFVMYQQIVVNASFFQSGDWLTV